MRRRFWIIGTGLLVVSVVLSGLTGCSRSAQERAPEAAELPATEQVEAAAAGQGAVPEAGETVVSVATPEPGVTGVETVVAVPGAVEVLTDTQSMTTTQEVSTPEPAASATPVATAEASSGSGGQSGAQESASSAGGGKSGGGQQDCRYVHKVKKGEWVWQIARDYGVSPYKILKANDLTKKEANTIHPGQKLCIP